MTDKLWLAWRVWGAVVGLIAACAFSISYRDGLTDRALRSLKRTNWRAVALCIFSIALLPWRILCHSQRMKNTRAPPPAPQGRGYEQGRA